MEYKSKNEKVIQEEMVVSKLAKENQFYATIYKHLM